MILIKNVTTKKNLKYKFSKIPLNRVLQTKVVHTFQNIPLIPLCRCTITKLTFLWRLKKFSLNYKNNNQESLLKLPVCGKYIHKTYFCGILGYYLYIFIYTFSYSSMFLIPYNSILQYSFHIYYIYFHSYEIYLSNPQSNGRHIFHLEVERCLIQTTNNKHDFISLFNGMHGWTIHNYISISDVTFSMIYISRVKTLG